MPSSATELRNRRKKRAKTKQATVTTTSGANKSANETATQEAQEESLWTTFSSHPLVQVAAVILPVFFVYRSYYFFTLQHPEYLQPILGVHGLRPSVGLTDERQLLIVGTMSSGTTQVAAELSSKLHLEVAHEASDTHWYFARDGTVSWFHGIRFLEIETTTPSIHVNKLLRFCTNFTANMGFHPSMYRSTSTCGAGGGGGGGGVLARLTTYSWSPCWTKECFSILSREWGCATRTTPSSLSCETPFRRVLHQVRHPLRTVESLVTKFCVGGVDGSVNPSFVQFMGTLFEFYDPKDSCIEAATKYLLYYTHALLEARRQGRISAMYRVEDVTPCQIAELAGLVQEENDETDNKSSDIVYGPNRDKIQRICGKNADTRAAAKEKMSSSIYQINKGQLTLDWVDLQGGVHGSTRPKHDSELKLALRKLTMELGYKVDDESVDDVVQSLFPL